jgi:choline-glycine betaine transporter
MAVRVTAVLAFLCWGIVALVIAVDRLVTRVVSCAYSDCLNPNAILLALVGFVGFLLFVVLAIFTVVGALRLRDPWIAPAFPLLLFAAILGVGAIATGQANTIRYVLRDDPTLAAQISGDLPFLILVLAPVPGLLFPLHASKSAGAFAHTAALVALASLLLAAATSLVFAYTSHDTSQQLLGSLSAFLVTWLVGWVALIVALFARRSSGPIRAPDAQGVTSGSALPPGI